MSSPYDRSYGGSLPENYQRYFVPSIGGPVAEDLIEAAALQPGERVLDVACGTGVVTRLAAERAGAGRVAGLDMNAGMIEVARASTLPDLGIEWYEADAASMPLADETYDVVLCQMGLQFMPDRVAALREMRRVLVSGGRVLFNVPGPTPKPFEILAGVLANRIQPEAAGFALAVFSLNDSGEIRQLLSDSGFRDIEVDASEKPLPLPALRDFLWQYIYSTPLANVVEELDEGQRDALEQDVLAGWQDLEADGRLKMSVRMSIARALK
ncbi:MAG: class I SAM-dependent methyltransferase [Alphaproteobacteria bacterium]